MRVPFKIGNTVVIAKITRRGAPSFTMINVHNDETTCVAAGKAVLKQLGGRLVELQHGGVRNIQFSLNGNHHAFDPNRIFSDIGIRETLTRQGNYSEAAHVLVKRFAAQYLDHFALGREPAIIALHNNSDGALSINSYLPGGEFATSAIAVHVASRRSPEDFFYVTDQRFFNHLKHRDFNVLLQDNVNVPDDGSLSVYFGKRGIPYVNIEAESSHLNSQIKMLRVTREMFGEFGILEPQ